MANLALINGPNLNMLGRREPDIYGAQTLKDIESGLLEAAYAAGATATCYQSNAEDELVSLVQQSRDNKIDFIIINPGAYTHTSIALRDAFLSVDIPFIEVHISNVFARESFRHQSYLSDIAVGVISGLGTQGYELAFAAALKWLKATKPA